MMEDNIVVMEYVIMIAMMMMNTHSLLTPEPRSKTPADSRSFIVLL